MQRAALAGALALCSCFGTPAAEVILTTDLDVSWTVDAQQSATKCTEYGLAKWQIEGVVKARTYTETLDTITVDCGAAWTSGDKYYDISSGDLVLTISALDAADQVLASKREEKRLSAGADNPWPVDFAFTAEDFAGTATGTIVVAWKITGTVDGTQEGTSWDSCSDVGAAKASVSVDGTATEYPCADNDMSVTLSGLQPRDYALSVTLLNEAGIALTSANSQTVTAQTPSVIAPFIFPFDSFFGYADVNGDYLYEQVFESDTSPLKCGETNPAAALQLILLKLDGSVIDADSCPVSGGVTCTPTDASASGPCHDQDHKIADLRWGAYKIKLQATPAGAGATICWEAQDASDSNEIDILVGAGTANPVERFVLERINSTGDCLPGS
jgi:hypothetical protein